MPTAKAASAAKRGSGKDDQVEGVHVTHPDRAMFSKSDDVTKRSLIDYYLAVADRMLPHIVGRPLALVRCPSGSDAQCFFQKHASPGWPD